MRRERITDGLTLLLGALYVGAGVAAWTLVVPLVAVTTAALVLVRAGEEADRRGEA